MLGCARQGMKIYDNRYKLKQYSYDLRDETSRNYTAVLNIHGNNVDLNCADCHNLNTYCATCYFGETGSKSPLGSGKNSV